MLGISGLRRREEIRKLLVRGMSYAQIGKSLGLSRERVRQLAEKYGYSELRWQAPGDYLPLKKYAESRELSWRTVLQRIEKGSLPALKLHNQWYVHLNESYRCRNCGQKLGEALQKTHRQVCDSCKKKAREKAHWRYFYRKMEMPLGPTLAYVRKPREQPKS